MKTTFAVLIALALLFPVTALAQTGPVFGVDAEVALPVGNLGDAYGLGFGGLLRYEFTVTTRANITARAGFVYHVPKDLGGGVKSHLFEVPLLAGIRFAATPSLYIAAEFGAFVTHASVDDFASDTSTNAGITVGGGYRMGGLDVRIGLDILDLGNAGDTIELVAGLGYNF
jgi:hypothetical protein